MPSKIQLREIALDDLVALRCNPQYLTEKQSAALQLSIETDGFLVPIIVRPRKLGKFEGSSGNHRVQAARSAGTRTVPCVVLTKCSDRSARCIALNMNSIHGDLPAELPAPFLAEMVDDEIRSVDLDDALMQDLKSFDSLAIRPPAGLAASTGFRLGLKEQAAELRMSSMRKTSRCRCYENFVVVPGRSGDYSRFKRVLDIGRHPTFIGREVVRRAVANGGVFIFQHAVEDAVGLVNPRLNSLLVLTVLPNHRSHGLARRSSHICNAILRACWKVRSPFSSGRVTDKLAILREGCDLTLESWSKAH